MSSRCPKGGSRSCVRAQIADIVSSGLLNIAGDIGKCFACLCEEYQPIPGQIEKNTLRDKDPTLKKSELELVYGVGVMRTAHRLQGVLRKNALKI